MRKFDHNAFVLGLGFVAGFIDVYGFTRLSGLLPAHITGNLIFLAIYIAHGRFDVLMYVLALPIFCAGVLGSAWVIGILAEHERDPFLPSLLLEAGLILLGMLAALHLADARRASSLGNIVTGSLVMLAMAMQNTLMRLVLNNLPPTTVMTGNLTQVLSDILAFTCRFPSIRHTNSERVILERQAMRMLLTLLSFLFGAVVSGVSGRYLGDYDLMMPVAALLVLIPLGQRSLRARAPQA
jgi:uncharacterized membrane protein YoaK (UPF0700 family)